MLRLGPTSFWFTIANILFPPNSPSLFKYVRLFRGHPSFIHQDYIEYKASDSFCVPSRTELRRKAIGLVVETYASAAVVVVADASMRDLSVSDPIQEQLFVLYVWT
jgi:hypothetical protein